MPVETISIVYRASEDQETWYTTPAQLYALGLNYGTLVVKLRIGSLERKLNVKIGHCIPLHDNELCLSADLKSKIFIPENAGLQIRTVDHHLEIGPLIGVFIHQNDVLRLFLGKLANIKKRLATACRALSGLCYFFSIIDIDWDNKLVRGVFRENQKWVTRIFPLPKVIYDRCLGKYSRRAGFQLRKKLGEGYQVINAITKLNKWDTYNTLINYPELVPHLPETTFYQSESDLEAALQKYERVYFKPTGLAKGKGVFRLSRDPRGRYKVEFRQHPCNRVKYLGALDEINELIRPYAEKGRGYLIQEALKLSTFKGNPFDFRLLYQKDWQGTWQPAGIAVRIAATGGVITSPRSGGTVAEFPLVLKEVFNEDGASENGLYHEVMKIGRAVAQAIDENYGDCVELGLDMAIDKDRKIWLIEVNGKPLRVSLRRLNNPSIWARCHYRPIEYAVYLTGFASADLEQSVSQTLKTEETQNAWKFPGVWKIPKVWKTPGFQKTHGVQKPEGSENGS